MTALEGSPDTFPTIGARAREYGIRIAVGAARHVTRANAPAGWDGWEHDAYRVKLTRRDQSMTLTFRKGTGHNGSPPTLEEVLDAVVGDASGVANGEPFETWADEYGYDPDSRAAEATWRACLKQTAALRRLVTPEELDALLLYSTERL